MYKVATTEQKKQVMIDDNRDIEIDGEILAMFQCDSPRSPKKEMFSKKKKKKKKRRRETMNWEKDETLNPILQLAIEECLQTGLTTVPARKYNIPVRTLRRYKARERKRRAMNASRRVRGGESSTKTTATTPRAEFASGHIDALSTTTVAITTMRRRTTIETISIPAPTKKRKRMTTIDANSFLLTGAIERGEDGDESLFDLFVGSGESLFEGLLEDEDDAQFFEPLSEDDRHSLDHGSSPFARPSFSRKDSSSSDSSIDDESDSKTPSKRRRRADPSPSSSSDEEHEATPESGERNRAGSFVFLSITELM